MHQFCLLFIFSLQTEENHRASGELELCNLCTWAVMSSGIESTPLPPHLALPGGEESSGPFLRGAVGGRDEAEPGVLGQPVRSQWQQSCGHWFILQIYYFNPLICCYRQQF